MAHDMLRRFERGDASVLPVAWLPAPFTRDDGARRDEVRGTVRELEEEREIGREVRRRTGELRRHDPAEAIMEATDGAGVDCGVEAVGHQAHDAGGQEHPAMVLDEFVEVARSTRADAGAGA